MNIGFIILMNISVSAGFIILMNIYNKSGQNIYKDSTKFLYILYFSF